jgi:hypothetical protein
LADGGSEVGHGHSPGRCIDLDDRARTGGVISERGKRPQYSFPAECRSLDCRAILHHGNQGNHAAFDEVDVLDPLLWFLKDRALDEPVEVVPPVVV